MHRELRKFTFIFRCNTHLFTRLSRVTARYHSIITVVCITVCKPRFENLFVGISDSVWIIFYHLFGATSRQCCVTRPTSSRRPLGQSPPVFAPPHSTPPFSSAYSDWFEAPSIWKSHAVRNTNSESRFANGYANDCNTKGPGSEDSETLTTPLRVPPTCTRGLADKSPNMERPPSATR